MITDKEIENMIEDGTITVINNGWDNVNQVIVNRVTIRKPIETKKIHDVMSFFGKDFDFMMHWGTPCVPIRLFPYE
jgi:hypothetical protein